MVAYNSYLLVVSLLCGVLADIEADYFFGNTLRTPNKELNCDNKGLQVYCEKTCGGNHACLFGKCFCLQSRDDKDDYIQKSTPKKDRFMDFDDYTEMTPLMLADTFPQRSALRHHIAHFCPNLEEARKCIRSCMKLGKPAFCGKDHVCYCGHKSQNLKEDEEADANKIYEQFHDLYTKYFGARKDQHDSHDYDYDNH